MSASTTNNHTTEPTTAKMPTTPETDQHQHLLLPPSILSPTAPSTFPADFDFAELTGQWYLAHTSSHVWRDKRNVILTYTPMSALPAPATGDSTTTTTPAPTWPVLDDQITYQSLTSDKLEFMPGTDTPQSPSPPQSSIFTSSSSSSSGFSLGGWGRRTAATPAPAVTSTNSAPAEKPGAPRAYLWRGTGLLKLVTSRWEIIGYGPPTTSSSPSPAAAGQQQQQQGQGQQRAWMVTFAQKTMFSPNAVNIVTRDKNGVGPEVKEMVSRMLIEWARGEGGEGGGGKGMEVLETCVKGFYDVRFD